MSGVARRVLQQSTGSTRPPCQIWHTMAQCSTMKALLLMGSSREDLKAFPDEVRQVMGYALYLA